MILVLFIAAVVLLIVAAVSRDARWGWAALAAALVAFLLSATHL